jgi:autotransporter-associated beta strand protein
MNLRVIGNVPAAALLLAALLNPAPAAAVDRTLAIGAFEWNDPNNWTDAGMATGLPTGTDLAIVGEFSGANSMGATRMMGDPANFMTFGGIRFARGASSTLTIDGGTVTLNGASGVLIGHQNTQLFTIAATNGGGLEFASTGELRIAATGSNQRLVINAPISGTGGFVKTGAGAMRLGGANTFSGDVVLREGLVYLSTVGALGTGTSAILLGDASTPANTRVSLSYAGAGIDGTITRDITVGTSASGSGGRIQTESGAGVLTLNGDLHTGTSANYLQLDPTSGTTMVVNGTIFGAGELRKSGGGTVIISGTSNSFTGTVRVTNDTLAVASIANRGTFSSLGTGSGTTDGGIQVGRDGSSGTSNLLFIGTTGQTDRPIFGTTTVGNATRISTDGEQVGQTLTFTGGFTNFQSDGTTPVRNTLRFSVGSGAGGDSTIIVDTIGIGGYGALRKTGGGRLVLNTVNTFNGQVTIENGELAANNVSDIGVAGALGTGDADVAAATIRLGNPTTSVVGTDTAQRGTFTFTGQTGSTDRPFVVSDFVDGGGNRSSGRIRTDGSVANQMLTLTGGINNQGSELVFDARGNAGGDSVITVGVNTITGAGGLTKTGGGVLVLPLDNTFSGPVNIENGEVVVSTVANLNNASGIGTGSDGGTVLLGNAPGSTGPAQRGTFTFSGTTGSTDRPFIVSAYVDGNSVRSAGRIRTDGSVDNQVLTLTGVVNTQGSVLTIDTNDNMVSGSNSTVIIANAGISGGGGLEKTGDGLLVLETGTTSNVGFAAVRNGNLRVNGNLTAPVTVGNGTDEFATLSGTGLITGDVVVNDGSNLSPGPEIGRLSIEGELILRAGSDFNWDINNWTGTDAGIDFDQVALTSGGLNTPDSTGRVNIVLRSLDGSGNDGALANFDNTLARSWVLIAGAGAGLDLSRFDLNVGGFSAFNDLGSGAFLLENTGNDLVLRFDPTAAPIPEPAALALLGPALAAGVLLFRRRRA